MSELIPILAEFMTIEELAVELDRNKRTLDRWGTDLKLAHRESISDARCSIGATV